MATDPLRMTLSCPVCHKTLPQTDRFCAYCGADLGWRLLPGLTIPRVRLPERWHITGGLAAIMGAIGGLFVAAPFANVFTGAFVGALLGAGLSSLNVGLPAHLLGIAVVVVVLVLVATRFYLPDRPHAAAPP